jgi:hypothetical protein
VTSLGYAGLITTGNLKTISMLSQGRWIIEAIVENLEIKPAHNASIRRAPRHRQHQHQEFRWRPSRRMLAQLQKHSRHSFLQSPSYGW